MRYFQQIAAGLNVQPLLHAVLRQPGLWNSNTVRTAPPQSAHRVVDDIVLRYSPYSEGEDFLERVCGEIACVNHPAFSLLPQAQPLVFGLMAQVAGERLGRVFISRMAPGMCIPPHTDRIAPAEAAFPDKIAPAMFYSRYQIPLLCAPGVTFRVGDEAAAMAPGEIWWFDNCVEHEVRNESGSDRISLVVDIRPFTPC